MSLEIIVNEGNKLGFLRVWRDHWAVARNHAPKATTKSGASETTSVDADSRPRAIAQRINDSVKSFRRWIWA